MSMAEDLAALAKSGGKFTPGLWKGDANIWLQQLGANRAHSIITDPPYGLSTEPDPVEVLRSWLDEGDYTKTGGGFMGQRWDSFVPGPATWRALWQVLRPGGHCLVFAGTRTVDWMTMSLRLAGFEIRDVVMWCYGTGFPKSLDIGKAIDKAVTAPATEAAAPWSGYGTALKPALEPIIVARKPLRGTVAQNVQEWGAGGLNIDACRIGYVSGKVDFTRKQRQQQSEGAVQFGSKGLIGTEIDTYKEGGRWPANLLLSCDCPGGEGEHSEPWCPVLQLDAQSGVLAAGNQPRVRNADANRSAYGSFSGQDSEHRKMDGGGASRFFYTGKAPRKERPEYVFERSLFTVTELSVFESNGFELPPDGTRIVHPTVKPLAIMQWLCRLVTPPDGLVLDPFLGTGSTAEAVAAEGLRWAGAEQYLPYWPLIEQRAGRFEKPKPKRKARDGKTHK